MAKLARAVHVTDPHTRRPIVLQPGEEPAPHLAALVGDHAWEGGVRPTTNAPDTGQDDPPKPAHRDPCVDGSVCGGPHCPPETTEPGEGGGEGEDTLPDPDPEPEAKPAKPEPGPVPDKPTTAAKKTAAKTPARGRKAASQGDGGQ